MIRRIVGLPVRVLKRALDTLDGERGAPSPAPPMAPIASPAPKKAAPKKAAPKKAAPKKAASKKAASKKAASKKAAAQSTVTVDPQETPNPNAMKFALNIKVSETGSFSFNAADDEIAHEIAAAIVALDGVVSVFGVNDFVTVSKREDADWVELIPQVVDAIKSAA